MNWDIGKAAVELGVISTLLIYLVRWLKEHLDDMLKRIISSQDALNSKVVLLNETWGRYIRPDRPLLVSSDQAKDVVTMALHRDLHDMLAFLSHDILWAENEYDERELNEKLKIRLWDILVGTREFYGLFSTNRGSLRVPLDEILPISEPDGTRSGDKVFKELVIRVVKLIKDQNKTKHSKMSSLKSLALDRLNQTKLIMDAWIDGNPLPRDHIENYLKSLDGQAI